MMGLRIKLLSPLTIAVKELPTITPTAISTTLPRVMNVLNSAKNFFIIFLLILFGDIFIIHFSRQMSIELYKKSAQPRGRALK
jgi:hypothetical protein